MKLFSDVSKSMSPISTKEEVDAFSNGGQEKWPEIPYPLFCVPGFHTFLKAGGTAISLAPTPFLPMENGINASLLMKFPLASGKWEGLNWFGVFQCNSSFRAEVSSGIISVPWKGSKKLMEEEITPLLEPDCGIFPNEKRQIRHDKKNWKMFLCPIVALSFFSNCCSNFWTTKHSFLTESYLSTKVLG